MKKGKFLEKKGPGRKSGLGRENVNFFLIN
jgi:hypothetical protein